MKKKISAIVDLDSLAFFVAYNQYVKLKNTGDPEKIKNHVEDFISNILASVEADEYMLFYQTKGHRNFRHDVVDDYKANRGESPDFMKCWGEVIRAKFKDLKAVGLKIIESDDALSIIQKSYDYTQGILIMCHCDKDIIANCPGSHYNFKTKEFKEISKEESCLLYHQQLLTGDSTDNIMGCGKRVEKISKKDTRLRKVGDIYLVREGIGPKTAKKLLLEGKSYKDVVFSCYKKEFGDKWLTKLKETKQLIGLLGPKQQYETFDIKFIENKELVSTDKLFNVDKKDSDEDLLKLFK